MTKLRSAPSQPKAVSRCGSGSSNDLPSRFRRVRKLDSLQHRKIFCLYESVFDPPGREPNADPASSPRGKFTDEMLAEMRALIGTELRTDGCVNNEYADPPRDPALRRGHRRRQPVVDRHRLRGATTPHGTLDRAAELHLRLPGVRAGRLAWARRLPRRDGPDLPPPHPPR